MCHFVRSNSEKSTPSIGVISGSYNTAFPIKLSTSLFSPPVVSLYTSFPSFNSISLLFSFSFASVIEPLLSFIEPLPGFCPSTSTYNVFYLGHVLSELL